jgi:CBS domain-containing protein
MPLTVQEILDDKLGQGGRSIGLGPDAPVREAVATMVRENIGSVVIMENGNLAGLLTLREVVQGLASRGAALLDTAARDVMNASPVIVQPADSADGLRSMMTDRHVSHAVVVGEGGLAGIISFHDIARSAVKDVAFENKLLKQYIKNWPQP